MAIASRKVGFVSAPRAFAAAGAQGQCAALTVSAVASALSLAPGLSQAPFNRITQDDPKSVVRNYITVECDVDLAVIFGATLALVTGANVPAIATVGSIVANVYTGLAGTAFVLYAKQPMRFLLQDQVDLFLGFVASGAGTMRLYQSSSDDA